jgi:uncharacterized membrane protein
MPWHPLIVHFPIALLIASVVLDALGVGFRRASLTQAGFYTLIGGSLGATAAVLTGPEHAAKDAASLTILHRHELFAALMVFCCLILVGMRLGNVNGLYGTGAAGYLALGVVLIVCIVLTGYFGGQMVYDRGVGVTALQGARVPATDAVQEMWAKLGGIALVIVIIGWAIARFRFLTVRLQAWWQATRSGTPAEQPTLWTLGLKAAGSEQQAAGSDAMPPEMPTAASRERVS